MDLVKSGIEEGFETALNETIKTSQEMGVNWRRAAYINSLTKLHEHYEQVGITFSKWNIITQNPSNNNKTNKQGKQYIVCMFLFQLSIV